MIWKSMLNSIQKNLLLTYVDSLHVWMIVLIIFQLAMSICTSETKMTKTIGFDLFLLLKTKIYNFKAKYDLTLVSQKIIYYNSCMIDIVAIPDSMWRKKNVYTSCVGYTVGTWIQR